VAALTPDAMGFVFWSGSKRNVQAVDVAVWTRSIPDGILKVGVFVDAAVETIEETVAVAGLDVVQLHGFRTSENNSEKFPNLGKNSGKISEPRKNIGQNFRTLEKKEEHFPNLGKNEVRIWRVLHLSREEQAMDSGGRVDAYLVDSYSEQSPGGTGKTCDWNVARAFVERVKTPVILAGGLTPENVAGAIRQVRPWGVDVSSGVEEKPGRKDMGQVKEFIARCRS